MNDDDGDGHLFPRRAVEILSSLEAGTLLTLQREDLTKLLQNVEDRRTISRLHSQLLKQRAINKVLRGIGASAGLVSRNGGDH